jgi:hypothetical protein
MSDTPFNLDQLDVASPCTASWDAMQGDERVRFCGECQLNVYNLSALTRDEAQELVRTHEGRLCGRFFKRADGTLITADCPVGLRAIRLRVVRAVAAAGALLLLLTAGAVSALAGKSKGQPAEAGPVETVSQWIEPPPPVAFMGDVCLPAPPPANPLQVPAGDNGSGGN